MLPSKSSIVSWPLPPEDEPPSPRPHTPLSPERVLSGNATPEFQTPGSGRSGSQPVSAAGSCNKSDTNARFLSAGSLTGAFSCCSSVSGVISQLESLQWDEQDLSDYRFDELDQLEQQEIHDQTIIENNPASTSIMPHSSATGSAVDPLIAIELACETYEEEYADYQAEDFPVDVLRRRLEKSDRLRDELRATIARVPTELEASLKTRFEAARRGFGIFTRNAITILKNAENRVAGHTGLGSHVSHLPPGATNTVSVNAPPPPPTGAVAKTPLVRNNSTAILKQINTLLADTELLNTDPQDEREYRTFKVKVAAVLEQVMSIIKGCPGLQILWLGMPCGAASRARGIICPGSPPLARSDAQPRSAPACW